MSAHSLRPGLGRRRPGRTFAGFTLVEVAVALVVFALGALSLAALLPLGTGSAANSGESTRASEIAASTMERLLATPWSEPELSSGNHLEPIYPYSGKYYVTWAVEDDRPITDCKRVTVTVRWPLANSATNCRLVGVVPRNGAN